MDEQRFELAFEEVEGYERAGEVAEEGGRVGRGGEEVVEEGVDEQGTEVFEDEDEAPGYLGA